MKRIALVVVFSLLFATAAISSETIQATGPFKASTVAEAKVSGVETNVILSGHVVKMIQPNQFIFADGTGELIIFADADMLKDVDMNNANIKVTGLISQNFMYTEIEATTITAIQ